MGRNRDHEAFAFGGFLLAADGFGFGPTCETNAWTGGRTDGRTDGRIGCWMALRPNRRVVVCLSLSEMLRYPSLCFTEAVPAFAYGLRLRLRARALLFHLAELSALDN